MYIVLQTKEMATLTPLDLYTSHSLIVRSTLLYHFKFDTWHAEKGEYNQQKNPIK